MGKGSPPLPAVGARVRIKARGLGTIIGYGGYDETLIVQLDADSFSCWVHQAWIEEVQDDAH